MPSQEMFLRALTEPTDREVFAALDPVSVEDELALAFDAALKEDGPPTERCPPSFTVLP